jgi:hypothetical protein
MDTRGLLVRGGLLIGVGLLLILWFGGVFPVAHIGMLLAVVGCVMWLLAVMSSIID